ncbi:MAG: outer membrane beta-barrel protein [Candidatus Dadabacteria bacterium]|nr:outer membrane beta-barrel protein [Candidatus Dadabacteria bacterium]
MKKAVVSIVVAVFMATGLPMGVSAQGQFEEEGRNGVYVVLDAGTRGFLSEGEVDLSNREAFAVDYDTGYVFGGGIGYDMGGFRSELAVSFSNNKADVGGFADSDPDLILSGRDTDVSTFNVLAKGIVDLNLSQFDNFVPYVGVALGYGRFKVDTNLTVAVVGVGTLTFTGGGSDNYFVYGGMAGFRYLISDKFSVGLESNSLIYYDSEDPSSSYNLKARVYYSF